MMFYIQWILFRSKTRTKAHPLLNIITNGYQYTVYFALNYQTLSGFVLCFRNQGYERRPYGAIVWVVIECCVWREWNWRFSQQTLTAYKPDRHILPNLEYDFYEYWKADPAQKSDQCWTKTENQNEFSVTDLI